MDLEPAGVHGLGAEAIHELAPYVFDEMHGRVAVPIGFGEFELAGGGPICFGPRDVPQALHPREHEVPSCPGGRRVPEGVVVLRPPRQPRQECRLRQIQLLHRPAEIPPGRSLHAVGAGAEVYLVQVHLQDFRLAELLLQRQGEVYLLELAGKGALSAEITIAHVLLGDRAAPLHDPPVEDVADQGPRHSPEVDTTVAEERRILHRHDGQTQLPGDTLQLDVLSVFPEEPGQDSSVGRVHDGGLPGLVAVFRLRSADGRFGHKT